MDRTETTRSPIAFALPIGGGWAHVCPDCVAAHRADLDASGKDPAILADAEPVFEFSSGHVPSCGICNRVSVEGGPFVDVESGILALRGATAGRVLTANEAAVLGKLHEIRADLARGRA